MVEIKIAYKGNLRTKALHTPSGQTLFTDAPVDNCGKGEYFSPTDLVATALGSCVLTIMGIAAQKHEIDLKGATATVVKEMAAAPVRRIGALTVTINVPTIPSDEHKTILEKAAHTCPVHQSLSADVKVTMTFAWGQ